MYENIGRREIIEKMQNIKNHPAYYWNYAIVWLASKGLISIKVLNKLRWSIN